MNQPVHKSRLYKKRNPRPKRHLGRIFIILILVTIISLIGYIFFGPHIWNGTSRLSVAVQKQNGDVTIITADPQAGSVTTINIPGNTQVSASGNLGNWQLSTIWQLGENEKKDAGGFLAATITKSFRFPIEAWGKGEDLTSITDTNLHLRDKIGLAIFSVGVKSASRVNLNLTDTGYITKTKLPDGSNGYQISQNIPVAVASIFTDLNLANKDIRVVIVDKMPDNSIASRVGEIIEVLGAKVTTINKETPDASDCVVKGKDAGAQKIAKLFRCKEISQDSSEDGVVEIFLGQAFKKRF